MPQGQQSHKEILILDAARKRFAYYGFSKVTMDEIAADVGLAKPSLYYYYPTKESLFRAVIAFEQGLFMHDMDVILNQDIPASQMLRNYTDMRFHLFRRFVNLSALGARAWIEVNALPWDLFKSVEAEEFKLVHSILSAGKASGEFALSDPQETATLLLHVFHGLRLRALRTSPGPRIDEDGYRELKKDMEVFVEVFLNSLKRLSSN